MNRHAFTMIELIFVIVILGILAAVAIPKLAATRDDAKTAKAAMDIASAVNDIGAYYTSQGSFNYDITLMSNVALTQEGSSNGAISATESEVWNYLVNNENCVDINVTGDGNVSVIDGASTAKVCQYIQRAVQGLKDGSPHIYSGNTVDFE